MSVYPVSKPCLGTAEREFVSSVMNSGWLTQGRRVEQFEKELASYLGVNHVVCCSSGTTALHLALAAFGIGPGHEVLVPDLTFVATANAVSYTGAKVVLVDVDPHTWTINVDDAMRKVTSKTRAIIPVHLYGVACDMVSIRSFATNHNLLIIEDAAEAFGGRYYGEPCGSIGDAGVFSFYANKILTTGEGGAVVTNNSGLVGRLRLLRGQAQVPRQRYFHSEVGFNYRMTELQAAVGLGQMTHLDTMLRRRSEVCRRYRERLVHLATSQSEESAPWLFTCLVSSRDLLMQVLSSQGIETRPTFVPLHRLPMYQGVDPDFPVASMLGELGMSLPTYPELLNGEIDRICQEVLAAEGLCKSR